MTNVAVIPARGGSKRIPRKNIKGFCGKPIIAYSIEAALGSTAIDKVIVSTDDEEIASVARDYGAEVPFLRPEELSDDHTGTTPVVIHTLKKLQKMGETVDAACCLYATAPFVTSDILSLAFQQMQDASCDYAFSVTRFAYPIQRALRINDEKKVAPFYPEFLNSRSQDLEQVYHDAGQFYWGTAEAWLSAKAVFTSNSLPVILPGQLVQDIDDDDDWVQAELKYQSLHQEK